jgi:hypothetical protein
MGVDLSVLDFVMKFRGQISGNLLELGKQGLHISGQERVRLAEDTDFTSLARNSCGGHFRRKLVLRSS